MPQSSILAWLGGNSVISPQTTHESSQIKHADPVALPTPPSSSPTGRTESKDEVKDSNADSQSNGDSQSIGINKPPLPSNVTFRPCTKQDIPQLKRLHALLLPLPYSESYYRETYQDPDISHLTMLAFWTDNSTKETGRLIGAIRCRVLPEPPHSVRPNDKSGSMLYLSTLALLSPYRGHGIAAHMLNGMTKRAVEAHGVTSVGAHVWVANSEGLEWYRKRGFREVGREKGYYRRLQPQDAVVVQRKVGVMDLVGD